MADASRKVAGFTELSQGVNSGIAPDLLQADQAVSAVNVSFRGNFPTTRPSWINHLLPNPPATWTGIFQGSMHYDGEAGRSGWIVVRGGRFFFITDDTFQISDVTPQLVIVTTADFTVPGAGNSVLVNLNGNPPVVAGDTIMFGGIHYTVVATFTDQIQLSQVDVSTGTTTAANYVQPGVGATVNVQVAASAWATVGELVFVAGGGYYTVTLIPDGTHLTLSNTGNLLNALPTTVITSPVAVSPAVAAGTPMLNATGLGQIIEFQVYPANLTFAYLFQAENYAIILGGHEHTMIWDGQQMRLSGVDEVPSGFLGAYGWGRIWLALPNRRTFVAGDIVFGPSGTEINGFRDAILKFTENDFLNEGGSFGVPYNAGPITAMQFLATQDTSLGIGVLLVGTTNMVFSVNAPVDRTQWKNLSYPIQTVSLIDYGPRGPRSTVSVNGDMWYRSEDGIRSFIVARRNFPAPGNTPMSHEISDILDQDTQRLLFNGSGMLFDNRLFQTVSPFLDVNNQIVHRGLVSINFDLVSNLKTKLSPSWEGLSTGLNILQISKARINDEERGFLWVQGQGIELWEMDKTVVGDKFTTLNTDVVSVATQPIAALLQTRAEDYGVPMELKRLVMGEIYLDGIADTVTLTISYKPDQYPNWIPWQTITLCSSVSQCAPDVNTCMFVTNARSYAARLTLPQPPDNCNGMTGKPLREFHDCQFQLAWTGNVTVRRFATHVKLQTQPTEGSCPPTVSCVAFPACDDNFFTYDSHP